MMRTEFIERTGFEPTAVEYAEIEAEYMGCDIDKDQFCKEWKKNGGIQRMMRLRARRIEELETLLIVKDREFEERTKADAIRYHELFDKDRRAMQEMEEKHKEEMRRHHEYAMNLESANAQMKMKLREAERQLAVLREAFEILGIGKEK